MLHKRRAATFAESAHDVHDPGRQAHIRKPIRHFERGKRGLLGRLKHARAAGGQSGREFPRSHQKRIVPGNDLSGDTDWLFHGEADRVVGNGLHEAENLGSDAAVVLEAGGPIVDMVFSLDDWLAGVATFQFGEQWQVLANFIGEAEEHAPALLWSGCGPRPFFEGRFGCAYCAIYIDGVAIGHLRDHLFRRGIVNVEGLARLALRPLAIDENVVGLDFSFDSGWHRNLPEFKWWSFAPPGG